MYITRICDLLANKLSFRRYLTQIHNTIVEIKLMNYGIDTKSEKLVLCLGATVSTLTNSELKCSESRTVCEFHMTLLVH